MPGQRAFSFGNSELYTKPSPRVGFPLFLNYGFSTLITLQRNGTGCVAKYSRNNSLTGRSNYKGHLRFWSCLPTVGDPPSRPYGAHIFLERCRRTFLMRPKL